MHHEVPPIAQNKRLGMVEAEIELFCMFDEFTTSTKNRVSFIGWYLRLFLFNKMYMTTADPTGTWMPLATLQNVVMPYPLSFKCRSDYCNQLVNNIVSPLDREQVLLMDQVGF